MRTIAETLAGTAAVVQINTEENQALAARFQVRGIPVLYLLRNGEVVAELAGSQSTESVVSWFRRYERG